MLLKMKSFAITSTILSQILCSLSLYYTQYIDSQHNFEKLSNFSCEIIRETTSTHTHTQDILIINLGGISILPLVNDMSLCIESKNPVVITDQIDKPMTKKNLRKATLVVLLIDRIQLVSYFI